MKECSKSILRRLTDSNFMRRYFVGNGVGIGGKPDPLSLYKELFPLIKSVKTWDCEDGAAPFLKGVAVCCLGFVTAVTFCIRFRNFRNDNSHFWRA